jgi:hypothetical protein
MKSKGTLLGLAVLLSLGLLLGYAGWRIRYASQDQLCYACNRAISEQMRTVASVNGRHELFCCPTCALRRHRQTGEKVKVAGLTDYYSRKNLAPDTAFVVEGSDVNHCVHDHMLLSQDKQINPMEFDRCSPSIISFGDREAADRFAGTHGGRVLPFQELALSYQH